MSALFLADKSALARMSASAVEQRLGPLLLAGELATCGVIDLEMLFSARDQRDFASQLQLRHASYEAVAMEQGDFDRAIEVMGLLARRSQQRGVTIPGLLISAVAERAGLIVLHYDSDFERIAAVTRQEMEWVVPRGAVAY